MKVDYITLAAPGFFALILVELWVAKRKGLTLYRLNDTVSNIGTGVMDVCLSAVFKIGLLGIYYYLNRHFALIQFPRNGAYGWLPWVLAFVGADFIYYWWHRYSHEINILWAGHAVHHQSQEYNLSVSLRQSWFTNFSAGIFYLPLALLGIPLPIFVAMKSFMIIYQFWIHTRLIDKLGPVEWIFNTPSHHRVHHGINPIYIDKNYAGTFIIWDRLFGTFIEESEEPVYGTVKPLASFNSIWAYFQYFVSLAAIARQCSRLSDKIKVWFMHPGWKPSELGPMSTIPEVDAANFEKYDTQISEKVGGYLLVQFVVTLLLATLFLFNKTLFSPLVQVIIVGLIIASVAIMGSIADRRRLLLNLQSAWTFLLGVFLVTHLHSLSSWL